VRRYSKKLDENSSLLNKSDVELEKADEIIVAVRFRTNSFENTFRIHENDHVQAEIFFGNRDSLQGKSFSEKDKGF